MANGASLLLPGSNLTNLIVLAHEPLTGAATVLMLALHDPAPPVMAVGVIAIVLRRVRPRLGGRVLAALFLFAVVLGTLARRWNGPASLLAHAGGIHDAVIGALVPRSAHGRRSPVVATLIAPRDRARAADDRRRTRRARTRQAQRLLAFLAAVKRARLPQVLPRFGTMVP
jgi:hypothetical protein